MYGSSIYFAEDRVFTFDDESLINLDIFQKIAFYGTRHGFSYPIFELAAFCPFLILSDTGTIWIDYSPQKKSIGFKSLKSFFNYFCNVKIFQEYVKSLICNGLNPLLDPE